MIYLGIGLLYSLFMKLIRDLLVDENNDLEDFTLINLLAMTLLWPLYFITFISNLYKK